jgi:hypothetical protein
LAEQGAGMTDPFTSDRLIKLGFEGFVTVRSLATGSRSSIPKKPGVYAVVRRNVRPVRFRTKSAGGWFKSKDPTVPTTVLRARWLTSTDVLYLGMASKDLQERIRALVLYGTGADIGHQGGRYVWQVQGSNDFVVCWTKEANARSVEIRLLNQFERAHGKLPFANLSH